MKEMYRKEDRSSFGSRYKAIEKIFKGMGNRISKSAYNCYINEIYDKFVRVEL